jgi:restriction endonuclease S subunit
LDIEFVVQFMNSRSWLTDVAANASGATRQRISRANMELLQVPVPPLAVQQRMAAKLRGRLARIDAIETAIRAE